MKNTAICLLVMATPAVAQDVIIPEVTYPTLVAEASSAEGFVPKGWKLDHRQSGDLNGDGLDDLMLVLIDDDPRNLVSHESFSENPVNTNPRILAVAFAEKSKAYRLVLENHTLIPRIVEPVFEDPFQKDGSVVSNGTMKISLYAFGSAIWQPVLQFRYDHGAFELIGFEGNVSDRFSGVTTGTSVNYLTGQAEITTGSIENDATKKTTRKLKKAPLLKLQDIGSGLDFSPLPD